MLLLIAVILFVSPLMAQTHVIKITPLKLLPVISNLQLGYEGVISDKVTLGVDFKIALPSTVSGQEFDTDDTTDFETGLLNEARLTGISITPQVRFYLSDKGAPQGFYLSPWVRYFNYKVAIDALWMENQGNSDMTGSFTWSGFGLGASLGWQWLLGESVVIDWNMGLGITPTRIGVEGSVEGPLVTDLEEFINDANAELNGRPFVEGFLTQEGATVGGKSPSFPIPVLRSNLSIGYAF